MLKSTVEVRLNRPLLLLFALLALLPAGSPLTAAPVIGPTNFYINVSSVVISTATSYGNTATTWDPLTYNFVFTVAKANTNYRMGVSVGAIYYEMPTTKRLYYEVDVDNKATTGCTLFFYTKAASKIKQLMIRLCIVEEGFKGYYFNYLATTYATTFAPGQTDTQYWPAVIPSMTISTTSVYQSIIGIDLVAMNTTYEVGFSISAYVSSLTNVKINVTSLSTVSVKLNYIYVMLFAYNNVQMAVLSPPAMYTLGFLNSTTNNAALVWNIASARPFNAFIGLTAFSIKGDTFFHYETGVNSGVSVMATSTNSFLRFSFCANVYEFFYCPDPTPYLMVATNTCYDICPVRYCSNSNTFKCTACPTYDCYYCGINGKCTECSAAVDFRQMNSTSMRCVPLPGYYESGVNQAAPCVPGNCLTCTSATSCLSCYAGKFLSGTACLACMPNCANCTAAPTCTACDPYYIFTGSACTPNCSEVASCSTCTVGASGVDCSACTTGYALASNNCTSVCGDGIVVSLESCDDGNTLPGDGCSVTCLIENAFFCNITVVPSTCLACSSNCINCTSASACTSCSTGYLLASGACSLDCSVIAYCATCEYSLLLPGTKCLTAQTGYELQPDNTCAARCGDGIRVSSEGCDDGATAPGDGCSDNCTVETGYYCTDSFPNASVCAQCIPFCSVCSGNTSCSTCTTNYGYDNSTGACVIDCSVIEQCATCDYTTFTRCLTCNNGYEGQSNNTCAPRCGDGKRVASEECDDGDNDDNDGCSSTCTVQPSFFCTDTFPTASTCSPCVSFCTACSNSTSCTTCSTNYAYDGSSNVCVIDCSPIALCATCDYTTFTRCLTCTPGYHVNTGGTNTCDPRCGDGFRVGSEACDDGNSNDTDGCSSNCTAEPAFFCEDSPVTGGVRSVCSACLPFCLNCSSASTCAGCQTAYSFNGSHCAIDCSPIALCASCDYPGSLNCLSCASGYYPTSNVCAPRCGDGILVPSEACDDGNTNSSDGCSPNCTLEPGFLCSNGATNTSCVPCLPNCVDCNGNVNDCLECRTNYLYVEGPPITCDIDCASFTDCAVCTFAACTACSAGYTLSASSSCVPTCGDGALKMGEICDDGNFLDGDGCSSACQLEANFECNTVSSRSVCSLLSMGISFVSLMKTPSANSITLSYQVTPASLPAFSTLDWSTVVSQQSHLGVVFSAFSFDSSSGQLLINADYSQSLDAQTLQLDFTFPPEAPFNLLNTTTTSTQLAASNNLALGVYSSDEYGQAGIVSYVALGLTGASAVLFLLGYLSGKLVGLECVTVFQLAFLSLLTCENLSPSFYGLSYLSYSCGYNLNSLQKSSGGSIGRRYSPVGQVEPFLNNYNLTSALFLLPLLLSLLFTVVNRLAYKSSNQFLLRHSQLLRGEGCFYGLMFSAYKVVLSLGVEVLNMGTGMVGLAIGGALILVLVLFGALLHCYPQLFGEFTEKFNKENCLQSHYYCFLIAERLLTAACLLLAFFNPLGAAIAALLAVQILLVVVGKPYAGDRAWLRPFLNLLFSVLIQAVFILSPMLSSTPSFARYAPFAVEGLLLVVLLYNIYYFVQQFRGEGGRQELAVEEEEGLMKQELSKLGNFQQQLMEGAKANMLDKTNTHSANQNEPDSPSRLSGNLLSDVRSKLNKVKMSSIDPNNVSFEGGLELAQDKI